MCNIFVCACSFKAFSVCSLKPWEDGGHEGVSEKWKEKAFRPGHFFSRYVLLSCFYFVMFGLCTVLLAFHDIKCSCRRQRGRTDGVRGTDICFSRGSTRDQLRRFLDHRCLPLRFVSPLGLNKKSRETQQLVWWTVLRFLFIFWYLFIYFNGCFYCALFYFIFCIYFFSYCRTHALYKYCLLKGKMCSK